jgi:hypothetical protein
VFPLPPNLRRLQLEALARKQAGASTLTFLRTRYFLCMHCAVHQRNVVQPRLRLDTLRQTMICSTCAGTRLVSIDMLGRVLRLKRQTMYLCPRCVSTHVYQGEQLAWNDDMIPCAHATPRRQQTSAARRRPACSACSEAMGVHTVERVDHLTGLMRTFSFCQRHLPRPDELLSCVNARQLERSFCA